LTQLTRLANGSAQVQTQLRLAEDLQSSPHLEALNGLAAAINNGSRGAGPVQEPLQFESGEVPSPPAERAGEPTLQATPAPASAGAGVIQRFEGDVVQLLIAQPAGWSPASHNLLQLNYNAVANGLTEPNWEAIAAQVPADDHAAATALARIAGWNFASIHQLAQNFNGGPNGLTGQEWATVAGLMAANDHAGTTLFARLANWNFASVHNLAQSFNAGALGFTVQQWAAVAAMAQHANAPATTFARMQHGQTLIGGGFTAANAVTLIGDFAVAAPRAPIFTRAVNLAVQMRPNVPFAEIRNFFNNFPAQALAAINQPAIADLITRGEVTGARLNAVLGILNPLGNPGMTNFLNARFPATPGLTLRRLLLRLRNFTQPGAAGGQNIAIGNVGGEFQTVDQSLDARVNNGTMSANARTWIQQAFRLLTQATRANMLGFLGTAAVNATFNQGPAGNAARWLLRFAQYHVGAPGAFAQRNVVVNAGGANRTVVIDQAIVEHVQERHTYEHFRLIPLIINRAASSTIINPPTTSAAIGNSIQATLGNPTVAANYPWAGAQFQVGAVYMRIAPIAGGNYRVSQYYYGVAPGLGDVVSQAVLHAIRQRFAYLVY
jgi:hypothetical protein